MTGQEKIVVSIGEIKESPVTEIAPGVYGGSSFGPLWAITATAGDDIVLVVVDKTRKDATIKLRRALDSLESTGFGVEVPEDWSSRL